MSLIVNNTEITDLIVIDKQGNRVEIETLKDQSGNILFEKAVGSPDTIFEVARVDSTVDSTASSFVAIKVLAGENGASVTYGNITKTVAPNTETGVYFGKYGSEADDGTPTSGEMVIVGANTISGYSFSKSKNETDYCRCITNVKSWGALENIGSYLFEGYSFTSIKLPNTIKGIKSYAFKNCSSLTSVTLPNKLEILGNNVFEKCSALTNITLPSSIVDLGADVFSYSGVTTINSINANIIDLRALTKITQVSNILRSVTHTYKLYLPTQIATFYLSTMETCLSVNSDTNGVIDLQNLTNLQDVRLADIRNEGSIVKVVLPNISSLSNTNIEIDSNTITKINSDNAGLCDLTKYTAFGTTNFKLGCSKVRFSSSLSAIPTQMFAESYPLYDITIPSSVKSIGKQAFGMCAYNSETTANISTARVVFEQKNGWQYNNGTTWIAISSSILAYTGFQSGTNTAASALCNSSESGNQPGYANYEWRNTN